MAFIAQTDFFIVYIWFNYIDRWICSQVYFKEGR